MDPIGKKLLDVVTKELGYSEKGDGYTKFGDWYAKNIDADHDSYFATAPWCDMFLAWAADRAGVAKETGQFGSTVEHASWFKQQGAFDRKPEPGAIVFFDWSGSHDIDQIDHVGIVTSVDGDTLHTIEGNAHSEVTRMTRSMDVVVGFGHPGKVATELQTAAKQFDPEHKYQPRHAAPAPSVQAITAAPAGAAQPGHTSQQSGKDSHAMEVPGQEAVLTAALAVVLCGTVALAVGRATAAKAPTSPPIRVKKRGKHHRPATPVQLPADLPVTELEAADRETTLMPALSQAAAYEAEDREFWGRIDHFKEDEELAFWDSLHSARSEALQRTARPERSVEYASAPEFR
ncbi:CHAP domain-containing protein [Actinomadura parmotrematis]|uniref:CHAP domain-containing protein n=1 Tax=Actinomadura parmotrematis TaxID=2864039 RepID=A0ABS7G357_9ACTN|nr:CHAP domain-containing protein [Actinomadura parmotrematis]MBW8487160.1 CHAP domain-containing protein [Actinomadura parmotrematis]